MSQWNSPPVGKLTACRCQSPSQKGDGYRLDRFDGYWKHNQCRRPSKLVLPKIISGEIKPQCPFGALKSGKCRQKQLKSQKR